MPADLPRASSLSENAFEVFRRPHDYRMIVQMLQLKAIYEQYIVKKLETFEKHQKGIVNNGKLCILALIGFLIKHEVQLLLWHETPQREIPTA